MNVTCDRVVYNNYAYMYNFQRRTHEISIAHARTGEHASRNDVTAKGISCYGLAMVRCMSSMSNSGT